MGQVLQILPFRNEVVRVTLRGDVILEILEHSASRWTPEDADGAFLQFSGITIACIPLLSQLSNLTLKSLCDIPKGRNVEMFKIDVRQEKKRDLC